MVGGVRGGGGGGAAHIQHYRHTNGGLGWDQLRRSRRGRRRTAGMERRSTVLRSLFRKTCANPTQCVTPPGHVGADETKKTLWHIGGVEGEGKVWAARKRFCVFLLASSATTPFFPSHKMAQGGERSCGGLCGCRRRTLAIKDQAIEGKRTGVCPSRAAVRGGVGKTLNFDEGSNKHRAG